MDLLVGWQGTLRLSVAGVGHDLGHHDSFATREVGISLHAGDSQLRLQLVPDEPGGNDSFRLVAVAANGRTLLPRPKKTDPVETATGTNLGRWLGLELVGSTLLFGVGLASISCGLTLAVRREARPRGWTASL